MQRKKGRKKERKKERTEERLRWNRAAAVEEQAAQVHQHHTLQRKEERRKERTKEIKKERKKERRNGRKKKRRTKTVAGPLPMVWCVITTRFFRRFQTLILSCCTLSAAPWVLNIEPSRSTAFIPNWAGPGSYLFLVTLLCLSTGCHDSFVPYTENDSVVSCFLPKEGPYHFLQWKS